MKTQSIVLSLILITFSFIACEKSVEDEIRNIGRMKTVYFSANERSSFSKTYTFRTSDFISNFDSTKQSIKGIEVINTEAKIIGLPTLTLLNALELSSDGIEPYRSEDYILIQYFSQIGYIARYENEKYKRFMQDVMNKIATDGSANITFKGYNSSDTIAFQNARLTFVLDMNIRLENK